MTESNKRALMGVAAIIGIVIIVAVVAPCQDLPATDAGSGAADVSSAPVSTAPPPTTSSAEPEPTIPTYALAPSSKVSLSGKRAGKPFSASIGTFSGTFKLNGNVIEGSALDITLASGSLKADDDALAQQLRSDALLDAERYAQTTFVSTRIADAVGEKPEAPHTLTGNLTFHGVLKSMRVPAHIELTEDTLELRCKLVINRKDFGLAAAELADEVRLELDLKFQRQ